MTVGSGIAPKLLRNWIDAVSKGFPIRQIGVSCRNFRFLVRPSRISLDQLVLPRYQIGYDPAVWIGMDWTSPDQTEGRDCLPAVLFRCLHE